MTASIVSLVVSKAPTCTHIQLRESVILVGWGSGAVAQLGERLNGILGGPEPARLLRSFRFYPASGFSSRYAAEAG